MADSGKLAAETEIVVTSDSGIAVTFVKSGGSLIGQQKALDRALDGKLPKGKTVDKKKVAAFLQAVQSKPITVEAAQGMLKDILDSLVDKAAAAPAPAAAAPAAAAPAPKEKKAPAVKKGDYAEWQKQVMAGLSRVEPFDKDIAKVLWANSSLNFNATVAEAIKQMKKAAPAKQAAKAAAAKAAAEAAAPTREAERRKKAEEAAAANKIDWNREADEEYAACIQRCATVRDAKKATTRPKRIRTAKKANTKAGAAGGQGNNAGNNGNDAGNNLGNNAGNGAAARKRRGGSRRKTNRRRN